MNGNRQRTRGLLALTLAALLAVCACGPAFAEELALTDMAGRAVTMPAAASRIVVLAAADCEILYALGAGDQVVGRGEYCVYPEQVLAVPVVQSGAETNIEQIIALEPQVVIMGMMAQTQEQVAALEAAGIAVLVSNAQDLAGVYAAIEMIGSAAGRTDEAAALTQGMQSAFAELSDLAGGDGTQSVYFEVSPLEWGLWTAGSGTFMDELATMLGLRNAFADVQGWGGISQEQVIERDPDIIVTIAMYFGEGMTPVEEILQREGWQGLSAVREGRILNADSNEISLPGPRLVDAAHTLYEFVFAAEDDAA